MNQPLDPQAVARQPTQQRARERFDRILEESEKLLLEVGLSGFSIPILAERLRYTRGSVYAYFPTHYAILNELVRRYAAGLEAVFLEKGAELQKLAWRESVAAVVDQAVHFHNSKPVARLLILGGAVTDDSYRAQETMIKRLGDFARLIWKQKGLVLPDRQPDVTTLATDIGTACFRRSYFENGSITPAYRDAAVAAMIAFLEPWIEAAKSTTARAAAPKTTTRGKSKRT
ncbi:MAG TPA: TetR/AcrR family transcriptional regulator [Nevskiaceae bacterium]|nr:TetR/AcrR family transcriptional regulator [Nevskiaceae bacterium]